VEPVHGLVGEDEHRGRRARVGNQLDPFGSLDETPAYGDASRGDSRGDEIEFLLTPLRSSRSFHEDALAALGAKMHFGANDIGGQVHVAPVSRFQSVGANGAASSEGVDSVAELARAVPCGSVESFEQRRRRDEQSRVDGVARTKVTGDVRHGLAVAANRDR
jgi:hypothetical protein